MAQYLNASILVHYLDGKTRKVETNTYYTDRPELAFPGDTVHRLILVRSNVINQGQAKVCLISMFARTDSDEADRIIMSNLENYDSFLGSPPDKPKALSDVALPRFS